MTDIQARGAELRRLHEAPELLQVVNVWDAISARVISDLPDTRALATASHSIAATLGYEDGENIPLDLMLDMIARIVNATDLPVSADLEGGYGDAGETIRRAIGVGSARTERAANSSAMRWTARPGLPTVRPAKSRNERPVTS